ncbi:MAG: LacI family DNA-binding transcriptional regulator [Opitutaceae bacterium]|nr:LacI family DNA-binding transcriptional regulator [Opitutaceae bacterium]
MQERRPTLKDIAARVGVHHTTVSLALRNHRSIPKETRDRIRAAADVLGYRQDPMLSAFMKYRRSLRLPAEEPVVLWITNYTRRDGWREPRLFSELFDGAAHRAGERGFRLEEFWLREDGMSVARADQIMRARGVSALVLAPQPHAGITLDLSWDDYSAITIGYTLTSPRLHLVSNHHFSSMTLLAQSLSERGYRRIGLALPRIVDLRVNRGWLGGYLTHQADLPPGRRLPPLLFDTLADSDLARWIKSNRPDIIISAISDGEPVWNALLRLGIRIPTELGYALVSLHTADDGRAGIYENSRAIGAAAMEQLISQWQRNERGIPKIPGRILIDGTWMPGWTIR